MYNKLCSCAKLCRCFSECAVNAAYLHSIHFKNRILFKICVRNRIYFLCSCSVSRTDMLFFIKHMRTLRKEKSVYTVMFCLFIIVRMHTTARNNNNVCTFSDVEIVINKVIDISVCYTGRNINRFALCSRFDIYIKSRLICF